MKERAIELGAMGAFAIGWVALVYLGDWLVKLIH